MYNVNRKLKHCTEKRSIKELHRSLLAKIDQSREFSNAGVNQLSQWQDWYDSSFISILQHNATKLDKDFNIRLDECLASIAHGLPPEQGRHKVEAETRDSKNGCPSNLQENICKWPQQS